MYGIIDCDNCYVSCERVFRPDLEGKPVVVLSNNDGCIVARSNEAKKLGIKAGLPFFQLAQQFPDQKIAVFSSNYELYGELTDEFPFPSALPDAEPVIEYMDGWETDISKITDWDKLPVNAQKYVEFVEKEIGCHIGYVSVGPERDSIIIR